MPCLICAFQCCICIGCRNTILRKIAFFPPQIDYKLEETSEFIDYEKAVKKYNLYIKDKNQNWEIPLPYKEITEQGLYIPTEKNRQIPALYYKFKEINRKREGKYIILFSHANSTNISKMRYYNMFLGVMLKVDVVCYEYRGYQRGGIGKEGVSDVTIIEDVLNVYQFVIQQLGYKPSQIILYGQSLGSGPTVFLASNPKTPVAAIILHSPLGGGALLLDSKPSHNNNTNNNNNQQNTLAKDFFPNYQLMRYVKTPTFIIHGTEDEIVPFSHALALKANCINNNLAGYKWIEKGKHNDLFNNFLGEFKSTLYQWMKIILQQQKHSFHMDDKRIANHNRARDWDNTFPHFYRQLLHYTPTPVLLLANQSRLTNMSQHPLHNLNHLQNKHIELQQPLHTSQLITVINNSSKRINHLNPEEDKIIDSNQQDNNTDIELVRSRNQSKSNIDPQQLDSLVYIKRQPNKL